MTPIVSELFLRTQSDERLVSLARSGHTQAFVAIVSRYQRELLLFARGAGPEARAEDVVQQALLNAFVALRGGTEVTHLRGWLYTIVRRGVAKAAAGEPVADADARAAAITESLEDVVLRRARARDTLVAVRGLPSRQRTALIATVFQGQRRSDIAQTLGQSEGAVRQLVHRARHNVRNAVGAVMPYPLARWVLPLRGGSPVGAPLAEVAGSSAMDGSVGVLAKFGAVLASGALATGIVAVPHRAPAARHHRAAASVASPSRPALRAARVESGPASATTAVRVVVRKASLSRRAMPGSSAGRGGRARAAGSSGDGRRGGGPGSRGDGMSGSRAVDGGPGPSSSTSGSGDQRAGTSGSGDSRSGGSSDGGSSSGGSSDGGSSSGGSPDGGATAPASAMLIDGHTASADGGSSGGSSDGGSSDGGSSDGGSSGGGSSDGGSDGGGISSASDG
jgi:RNA polymerase sigma factor (sigma-70 family)